MWSVESHHCRVCECMDASYGATDSRGEDHDVFQMRMWFLTVDWKLRPT